MPIFPQFSLAFLFELPHLLICPILYTYTKCLLFILMSVLNSGCQGYTPNFFRTH